MIGIPRSLVVMLVISALAPLTRGADPAAKRRYDIPRGDAVATLKLFAEQSGEQVFYLVPKVKGVKTNPVKGTFTTREVLERMLGNTELVVVRDEKTSAIMINRAPPRREAAPKSTPNAQKSSQSVPRLREPFSRQVAGSG